MSTRSQRIPVAVLGATGMVGQRFIERLQNHPWFDLVGLGASEQHHRQPYGQVAHWRLSAEMPASVATLPVVPCHPDEFAGVRIVFSALPADVASAIEASFAQAGVAVFSNARNYRLAPDIPLVVPEVNPGHIDAIARQRRTRHWPGFIVTNANCSATPLVMALKPLQEAFGLRKVLVTTMQAISGAGYPGVAAYDILDNVIPFIGGEEAKMESETLKMLGDWNASAGFTYAPVALSAHCTRVSTREGHLECVSVEFARTADPAEVLDVWQRFNGEPQRLGLPGAPRPALIYRSEADRPQTLLDRDAGGGMAVTLGRLRPCPVLQYKFVLLGHNTIRGAAGGSLLNAELCVSQGYIP